MYSENEVHRKDVIILSYTLRIRKNGQRVYEIRVSRGRDPITHKQLTPYTMTWAVPENYSAKRAEKEAAKIEGKFLADCKAGKVLTKQEERLKKKEDAERAEREQQELLMKPKFQRFTESFLQEVSKTRAPTTHCRYCNICKRASKTWGDFYVEDITKNMIKDYIIDLQGHYKHATVCGHFKVLRVVFNYAVENEVIPYSPMQGMKLPKQPKDELTTDDKAYNEKEVSKIMECMEKEPSMWRTMFYFMLDSGCRRGEVAGLKWENIDMKTGEVTICNNLQYLSDRGKFLTTPKSGKVRTIYLTQNALTIMRNWKKEQVLEHFKNGIPQSDFCFTDLNGQWLNPQNISRWFHLFGKRNGFRKFHPHALRHTMATLSIANGADVVSVSRKLGHATPSITLNVYSHANDEAQKRANEILAEAIYNQEEKKA